MTTLDTTHHEPRQSVLYRATKSQRASSPESTRQGFMLLLSLSAAALSGYYVVTLPGADAPRVLLAVIFAGWFAMVIHVVRSASSARND